MKKNALFSDVLQSVTKYFVILVVIVTIGIFCSGIRIVKTGNVALVLRFGKLVGDTYEEQVHEPGLLLAFPYIIDEVIMVPTSSVIEQSVTTYFTGVNGEKTANYVMTGDHNIAQLSASVKYVIDDPVAYALNVKDISSIINACVSNAMLSQAAQCDVDDLLTTGKDMFAMQAMAAASQKLAQANTGVKLTTLELTQVAMPEEVREIYEKVTSANVQTATIMANVAKYREKLIPSVQTQAQAEVSNASANYSHAVAEANSALAEFWGVLSEYEANPELIRARIYSDKIQQIIAAIGKVRVVQEGETKIFLTLPESDQAWYQPEE